MKKDTMVAGEDVVGQNNFTQEHSSLFKPLVRGLAWYVDRVDSLPQWAYLLLTLGSVAITLYSVYEVKITEAIFKIN